MTPPCKDPEKQTNCKWAYKGREQKTPEGPEAGETVTQRQRLPLEEFQKVKYTDVSERVFWCACGKQITDVQIGSCNSITDRDTKKKVLKRHLGVVKSSEWGRKREYPKIIAIFWLWLIQENPITLQQCVFYIAEESLFF